MIKTNINLKNEPKAYHGAIDHEEIIALGLTPDSIIDFSVNSNPFGPDLSVLEALKTAAVSSYPDKACLNLRQALAHQYKLSPNQIMVGNGTTELLWLIAFAFIQKSDKVMVLEPTFAEYRRNARLMGGDIYEWRATIEHDFALDETAIEQLLHTKKPKILHICSPNNPTGYQLTNQILEGWSALAPNTLLVIDEAYAQFLPNYSSAMSSNLPNVLVLRSMTKDYSLAGIRLGYVTGPADLIQTLEQASMPWSVNTFAQIAGTAAIAAQPAYETMWRDLQREATAFKTALKALGYPLIESPMHYFLMEVGNARLWRERLLKAGLLVRLCDSYELPNHVRLSTQRPEQNQQLLDFLRKS